jgi:hypothetical protein
MNKNGKIFTSSLALLLLFSVKAFGCTCAIEPYSSKSIEQRRAEKKLYFLNEFSGAAFTGKIVKRERVNVKWIAKTLAGEPTDSQMYKYTIRVSEYWLGVKSSTLVVYGEPIQQIYGNSRSGSSCGFKLKVGTTYFFTPGLYDEYLTIGQCDYAGGGSEPNGGRETEFRKIMGEPKRF